MNDDEEVRKQTILELSRNLPLAHAVLFRHRHSNHSTKHHLRAIDMWHSPHQRAMFLAFRGFGKSTLAEEGIVIESCFQTFKNGVILGETYERACERLNSIKNEFQSNPYIEDLFGNLVGPVWQEGKIILTTGIIIQAFGRMQSLRGSKHLDQRPDKLFGDDIEDLESVQTPEARQKTKRWFWGTVLPALDPKHSIRIAATPLNPDALPASLEKANFKVLKIPICYIDPDTGEEKATWPDRFPIKEVEDKRNEYHRLGMSDQWQQEYMCEAEDQEAKSFTVDLFKVRPQIKTWQATWAFYDPARTVKTTSASTGVAVWSWVNNRLIVWDAYGKLWKPDEIIEDIFKVNETYSPIAIGVEPDGLEEFIMQPLRQAQRRYGEVVPFRPVRAPKSKLDFIRGLQPFFKAGEIEFVKELPDLTTQLLSFPTGRIDVPNALAYALKMRPGLPIYEDFDPQRHVEESLRLQARSQCYVAWNATTYCTTAVLFQFIEGALHIFKDWIREGEPNQTASILVSDIGLEVGKLQVKHYATQEHFKVLDNIGLRSALRQVGVRVDVGGNLLQGREGLGRLFTERRRGGEAVQVAMSATRVLNGLSGGYARDISKSGILTEQPVDNIYKIVMEGLESVIAFTVSSEQREEEGNYETTPDGRRYLSARVINS